MKAFEKLHARSTELTRLGNILALLQWDQEVMMPGRAGRDRAAQIALLSGIMHCRSIDPKLEKYLAEAEAGADHLPARDRALVRLMRRDYNQKIRLPENFVSEFAHLTAMAMPAWVEARRQSDFSQFQPLLEKIVTASRQKAEFLGYAGEPYDSLLDEYEEDLTATAFAALFNEIRPELSRLAAIAGNTGIAPLEITTDLDETRQIAFAESLLAAIGYDFNRGRQDKSPHPFTTSLGHHDRRITNRYQPRSLEFVFSALHEGGHGIYEQGIAGEIGQTRLDDGASLGIHESQSRLWENIIGRSLPFWELFFPRLQASFPAHFSGINTRDFVRMINRVEPGLIRVEADEFSYNLHILIRFELERALMDGAIKVADLPELWRQLYRDYLGVMVDSDANGVLQDIHWAHGSFGYFPTYTIGNLAAAQIWQAYCRTDSDPATTIRTGNFNRIRLWLTEKIYRHGAAIHPAALVQKVCGEPLDSRFFLQHLQNKLAELQ